ncbi:MAG: hypothetical protein KDK36_14920 [Leptospiraceae bacterium]|nr:hypothetical protein [Leptospiraceae bacterium]
MKKINQKFKLLTIVIVALFFQNCFEILHYIDKNQDGSLNIKWMFSISSAFDKKGNDAGPPAKSGKNLGNRIKSSEEEIKEKMKNAVEDFKYETIENEYEVGVRMSFKVKDPSKTLAVEEFDEGFPIIPLWKKDKNQLIFKFREDKKKKEKSKSKKVKSKKNENSKDEESDSDEEENESEEEDVDEQKKANDPTQKIVSMIMSSANYKIMLGDGINPKKVYLMGQTSKKKVDLEVIKFGELSMVKIPFMSLLSDEKDGFDLILQM